jgi:single-strand DNA-binding protein
MIKVSLIGNLGSDPELRYTAAGKAVCSLSVAVQVGWGENKKTQWWRCTLWDKQAETAAKYLKKGTKVWLDGEPTADKETGNPRTYTRTDGTVASSWEMSVRSIEYLSKIEHEVTDETQADTVTDDVPF